MNVAIVSCFISNEMRVNSVKEFFKKKGHSIVVIESDFVHIKKAYRDNPPEGHIYLHTVSYKKNLSIPRLFSHARFSKDVIRQLEYHNVDLIYALVPPNSLVKDIIAYKKKKNVKVIFDVIDLWPESLPFSISSDIFPLANWRRLRNKYINEADYVVTQCDLYQTYFNVDTDKCKTIYFCKEMVNRTTCGGQVIGELNLAYLGSINNLIDIVRIGSVIETLKKKYTVTVHVVGNGSTKELFLRTLEEKGATVKFYGEVYDSEKLTEIFSRCDFGINIYKPMTCIGMTMKSIDYFCYNLPVINNILHDTERLVKQYNAGINLRYFSIEAVEQYKNSESNIVGLVETELSLKAFEKKMEQILKMLK